MKKILFAASALLILAACNRFATQVYEDDLTLPLSEESADSLHMAITIEYVTGGIGTGAMAAINHTIASQAFDLEEADGTLEECAAAYRENLIDLYLNENDGKEGLSSWEDQLDGIFMPDWDGKKNYTLSYYSFRGGAHGIMTVSYLVFDPKTGRQLTEADLFQDGYKDPVAALMREALQKAMAVDEEFQDMVDMEMVTPNGNFSLDAEGITWVFQPYEVGPYALGLVTADVPWESLKPYLK